MNQSEEQEHKNITDHDYDGIKELDNKPPAWIMWIFWLSIFWGAIYLVHYHAFKQGDLQAQEYEKEVAKANQNKDTSKKFDETKVALITDSVKLNQAKELFVQKTCIACHGKNGEGNTIGPNLCDTYWINGGNPNNVFKIIKYGNSQKGMTAFKDQLTNEQIQMLVSYILIKLKNSNPQNAKAPQGNLEKQE